MGEILMAERAKDQKAKEGKLLEELIKKHEELIPTVSKTQVMVDLYWKCYAYGDELKPHIEFLDGIMLSSTRDIAPSCLENVDELIERQEKSLTQLDSKRGIVVDLIAKGKVILEHPDKPKFLESHVQRIEAGWDDTKNKAQERLKLLQDTKDAWIGYGEDNETIAVEFEVAEEEISKVKKRYNLEEALADMKKRQDLFNKSHDTIMGLFNQINAHFTCMSITLPEDKKKSLDKEIKGVDAKLEVVTRFKSAVKQIEDFCAALQAFDTSLKTINDWMLKATDELNNIKESSGSMLPEDRVARTMDLQEDIAAKKEIIKKDTEIELGLLPQGEGVPTDAQNFKDELARITKYVNELQANTIMECDKYSNDVNYWAEYRTGIKEFTPWLVGAEKACGDGLSKPSHLNEVKALNDKVSNFAKVTVNYLRVLEAANGAAQKMTTHAEADAEVAALRERYAKVKATSDEWVKKVDILRRSGSCWTTLSLSSTPGWPRTSHPRVRTSSLWRRWSPLWESSRTSSRRRRSWWMGCK